MTLKELTLSLAITTLLVGSTSAEYKTPQPYSDPKEEENITVPREAILPKEIQLYKPKETKI